VHIARSTHGFASVALVACFVFTFTFAAGLPRAGAQGQGREAPAWAEEARTILGRFQAGDDAAVLSGMEQFFARYPVDADTWPLLLYRAESHRRRGQPTTSTSPEPHSLLPPPQRALKEHSASCARCPVARIFFKNGGRRLGKHSSR
jgi:hypothetical protein